MGLELLRRSRNSSGLGLYIVKKIVDNEKGKIIVNSKPGEGSEFNIYLKQTI
jgi:two-component system phosphate regulon sensor histidine kinase PhoR